MVTKVKIDDSTESNICKTKHVQHMYHRVAQTNTAPDFLCIEAASRLLSKVEDIKMPFNTVLDLGCGMGTVKNYAPTKLQKSTWVQTDITPAMLSHIEGTTVCLDMQSPLPFKNGSFDLILSNLALPYISDVTTTLIHMGRAVKKGGLILASTIGQESFRELKQVYAEIEGTTSFTHFMPMPDVKEVGRLMQSCGFELPVSDRDLITINYPSLADLFTDLKSFGGQNLYIDRPKGLTSPKKMQKIEQLYRQKFAQADGSLPVTVELIYLHGFRPA